jgi:hypothetical protein
MRVQDLEIKIYEENDKIRNLIDTDRFFRFEKASLQDLTNSDKKRYYVSPKDSHPNHLAYDEWNGELVNWIEQNQRFGFQL